MAMFCRMLKPMLTSLWTLGLLLSVQLAWSAPTDPFYTQGVESYRAERFTQAKDLFTRFTQTHPEVPEGHYYLGITLVKLGQYPAAKQAYENAIKIAPQSEAGQLAAEGLKYLPGEASLDKPPQITASGGISPNAASNAATGGMDPQMLQTMMMMSAMGGNGNSGFNPMLIPMMQSMNKGPGGTSEPGQPQFSSEMMKSLMMNQMMQNFSPMDMGKDD